MIASLIAIAFRSLLLARFLLHAPALALPFALSEGLVIAFTIYAVARGRVDGSATGALVPLCYCAPLLFSGGPGATHWRAALLVSAVLVLAVRLDLLERVTIGAPVFTAIKTDGLYRFCRHPIAAAEMLMAILWPLTFPTVRNIAVALLCFAAIYSAALIEESFLLTASDEYQRYKSRVRSRFVPNFCAK